MLEGDCKQTQLPTPISGAFTSVTAALARRKRVVDASNEPPKDHPQCFRSLLPSGKTSGLDFRRHLEAHKEAFGAPRNNLDPILDTIWRPKSKDLELFGTLQKRFKPFPADVENTKMQATVSVDTPTPAITPSSCNESCQLSSSVP